MSKITSKSLSNVTYSILPPLPTLHETAPISYLTSDECAAILRVTTETFRQYVKSGRVKGSFIGRSWLVKRTDLDLYVASLAEGGPSESTR